VFYFVFFMIACLCVFYIVICCLAGVVNDDNDY